MTQATARKARMRRTASDAEQIREQAPEEHASGIALAVPSATEVGRADDPAEVAADRMADSVLSRLAPADPDAGTGQGQPQPARRSGAPASGAAIGAEGGSLDASSEQALQQARGQGRRLPSGVLERMESGFGQGFSDVRVHDDERSATLARNVSAQAFTSGSDIFLGAAAPRPTEAGGDRLLAHELAHVVQGGNAAHRWPFDSKDKDPAEEQRKADEKAKKKDDKKKQKAQDKQVKADTKQTVKESKKALTVEEGRLKGERKVGKEDRAGISANIASDTTTLVGQKDTKGNDLVVQSGDVKKDLDLRFKVNLEFEEKLFAQYRTKTPVAEAATKAYDEAWMKCPDPEVRAVRPPRETEAERLVSEVKHARGEANVRGSMDEEGKRGKMLPKHVEQLYEEFEARIANEIKGGKSKEQAEVVAQFEVWAKAKPELLADRPKPGSGVDKQAREDARRRLAVMPTSVKKENGLEEAQEAGEKVEGAFGKAEKVLGVVSWAAKVGGSKTTASMRESFGEEKGFDDKQMVSEGLTTPEGGETKIPIVGEDIEAIEQAKLQVSKGVKTIPPGEVPTSVASKVGEGFGVVTEMLSGLIGGVNGAINFARAVQKAHSTGNPRDILAATKIGADALGQFNSSAKSTAGLAQLINPDVTVAVAHVVPGLDILAASLSIVSGTMSMVETGIRVQDTQTALNKAHAAKSGDAPNVLVYPLLRVEQSYVKNLEMNTWSTVKSVSDLAASIAQLASAGGYGIPAAYKAATNILTLLHKLGHIIADDVLTMLAKQAQKDSVAVLEGAAENQLKRDPAMAVDGIIMSAVKGDKIAEGFLGNFAVDNKSVDRAMLDKLSGDPAKPGNERVLVQIRGAVLKSMGNDEDPTYTYQKYKKSIGGVLGGIKKHTVDKFADTGEIAEGRNAADQGERGVGWRMKMMFTSEQKLSRAKNRLAAEKKHGGTSDLPPNIECRCGDAQMPVNPSDSAEKEFVTKIDAMADATLLKAANDPSNPAEWQKFFLAVLHDRGLAKAKASAKK